MRHQLVGLLRRGVEAQRVIHVVVHGEREPRVRPVDGARRREDQVLDGLVSTPLENVEEPDEVRVHVGARVLQRVADAGLRRQVHDADGLVTPEEVRHRRRSDTSSRSNRNAGCGHQPVESRLLQRRVVVVHSGCRRRRTSVAVGQQPLGDVKADESGSAGDQDRWHQARSIRRARRASYAATVSRANRSQLGSRAVRPALVPRTWRSSASCASRVTARETPVGEDMGTMRQFWPCSRRG